MKLIFLLMSCFLVNIGFCQLTINDPYAEVKSVPEFSSVTVSGGIDVILTHGKSQAVVVSESSGSAPGSIVAEVKNGVLHIYPDSKFVRLLSRSKLKAYISYTTLENLSASGAVSIKFAEDVQQERLQVSLSGASKLKATVQVTRLDLKMSGASDARLSGTGEELTLVCSGASDLKAYDLTIANCDAKISGASDVQISVDKLLTVNASGASDLFYKGNPKTEIRSTGSSTVRGKD